MTIWKFPIETTDRQLIDMPGSYRILTVQIQGGVPCLWAMVDPSSTKRSVRIAIYGTGHTLPDDPGDYIGTYQLGMFVFHVFGMYD